MLPYTPIHITPWAAKNPDILKDLLKVCVDKVKFNIEAYRAAMSDFRMMCMADKQTYDYQMKITSKLLDARTMLLGSMADVEKVVTNYYGQS